MSLRSFSEDTLQDNWYEERSEPLQGVLPFDEKTNFKTTNVQDFTNPRAIQERHELHKKRPRMIRGDNYEQAVASRPLRNRPDFGFGAILPTPDPNHENRYLKTISQEAFGVPTKDLPRNILGPAGGAGGVRLERGKAASGASGEVIRTHSDPQKDTHAQRSWMYTKDPILSRVNKKSNQEVEDIKTPPPAHYRRQSTNITSIDHKKDGIFIDD
ncbi:cleavage induced hypothetical protein [Thraustotheca clavata]|uniref:Uncharacterized protein n=1 Tax=Thraustotheca clavata TaxID=74557 RepID=A0A1V9YTP5_9STRA|nr:cleavage induced hypothetical protein [Thraustotheca clavata]